MARETQLSVLLRIVALLEAFKPILEDIYEASVAAPVSTNKSAPAAQKQLADFYTVGAFEHKSGRPGEVQCGLCKQVCVKEQSMIGPNGHLWLRHRKQMKAAGIKY